MFCFVRFAPLVPKSFQLEYLPKNKWSHLTKTWRIQRTTGLTGSLLKQTTQKQTACGIIRIKRRWVATQSRGSLPRTREEAMLSGLEETPLLPSGEQYWALNRGSRCLLLSILGQGGIKDLFEEFWQLRCYYTVTLLFYTAKEMSFSWRIPCSTSDYQVCFVLPILIPFLSWKNINFNFSCS